MQNKTGGFGGGHGQTSHCAASFAALLSLALVGGNEAFRIIDRHAMWVAFIPTLLHIRDLGLTFYDFQQVEMARRVETT